MINPFHTPLSTERQRSADDLRVQTSNRLTPILDWVDRHSPELQSGYVNGDPTARRILRNAARLRLKVQAL